MAKKATEVKDLIINGAMEYKLTISKEGYELQTKNTINNDVAAMLHARAVVDMIKKDCEITKKSDMYKALSAARKKQFNDRYSKLIHATYILGTISGELLMKAMYASEK
jgi:hypothetical protein